MRVVTGLPVEVWSKDTVKQVRASLVGTHIYRLNGVQRSVTVDGVMVVMEGAGAQVIAGLPDDVPQAVIDIGGRTTDLFWTHGSKPIIPRCKGLPIGAEKIGDELRIWFSQTYKRELQAHEIRSILRAYAENRQQPPIFVNQQPVQLNDEVGGIVNSVGDEIASFVAQTWRTGERSGVAADAAQVALIGGHAHYFRQQMQDVIGLIKVPTKPETANARGYYAMGEQFPESVWGKAR